MKSIAFVIPYFGKFNNYFQLFLNSCKYNTDCDWIIFTDDNTYYDYPENVIVHYITFEKIKQIFQDKFNFKISLEYPYKLCDYRPSYGYIFSEYISNYKFWGYCDTDLIWGKISNFINIKDLDKYDKIGFLGHCTIYKNNKLINNMFMSELNGVKRYKDVLTTNGNCSFDEEFNNSINNIFEYQNLKIRKDQYEANIYTKSSNFRITRMEFDLKKYIIEKNKKSFFVWDRGVLFRYIKNKEITVEEYMYMHLQSRKMTVRLKNLSVDKYKIIPNSFDYLERNVIESNNFKEIRKKYFNLHYFKLRSSNLLKKIIKNIS
ncbi:DUF6625 family protein [Clostridium butyricum]|uniref:DUF6625 family protein n=1 Tax=Clostridium butyricum TaxID=1492 RepID=UPI00071E57F5|nr:DUF6625 family protein [Clostridium butyricum]MCQ2015583.1 hypothetical protein [Clostridium butyricum]MCQ2027172.1 hypothetical protein [Clostridium butyricum]